ncbi:nitroreductase family protein [Vibrio variabilis]|nr:nitroreductase family protein [Vibrio variabilis]
MKQELSDLYQRVSYHVHEMRAPAPDNKQMQAILQAAMSTPDHGRLKPWHFLVIEPSQIPLMIANLRDAWLAHDKQVSTAQANRLADYLAKAPSLVLISAQVQDHREVSKQDQLLSAAAACQMTLLAADQLGFGGVWYSTDAIELPGIRQLLGLTEVHVPVGFMVFGTPIEKRTKNRGSVSAHTQVWHGPNQVTHWLDEH